LHISHYYLYTYYYYTNKCVKENYSGGCWYFSQTLRVQWSENAIKIIYSKTNEPKNVKYIMLVFGSLGTLVKSESNVCSRMMGYHKCSLSTVTSVNLKSPHRLFRFYAMITSIEIPFEGVGKLCPQKKKVIVINYVNCGLCTFETRVPGILEMYVNWGLGYSDFRSTVQFKDKWYIISNIDRFR